MAIMMAITVRTEETAPAMARLPVEKMAPMRGVMRVTPQVGQPAPRAIRPVMMPALPRLSVTLDALEWAILGVDLVVLEASDIVLAVSLDALSWGRFL